MQEDFFAAAMSAMEEDDIEDIDKFLENNVRSPLRRQMHGVDTLLAEPAEMQEMEKLEKLFTESEPLQFQEVEMLHAEPAQLIEDDFVQPIVEESSVSHASRAHRLPVSLPAQNTIAVPPKTGKKRGSYKCGKCGAPKKGHVCVETPPATPQCTFPKQKNLSATPASPSYSSRILSQRLAFHQDHRSFNEERPISNLGRVTGVKRSLAMVDTIGSSPPLPQSHSQLAAFSSSSVNQSHKRSRGPLIMQECSSLDDYDVVDSLNIDGKKGIGVLTEASVLEVFKRLPPSSLLEAGKVCSQWHKYANYVWSFVIKSRLVVSAENRGKTLTILSKCQDLKHLTLRIESEIDDFLLKSITQASPFLEYLEIQCTSESVNTVTGEGLRYSISACKSLRTLKMEKCSSIRSLNICSTNLSTLWLHDCHSITAMVLNCTDLSELSLTFLEGDDLTNLSSIIENLGQTCTTLARIHIVSSCLTHSEILALEGANLRLLSTVSLTHASRLTDASVSGLVSTYRYLKFLDLSGSSITDEGLYMICTAYQKTLTKLLLSLCPNITVDGLKAVMTLQHLQLLDCGESIKEDNDSDDGERRGPLKGSMKNQLIISHSSLRKISLWGCSGLQSLSLCCPKLVELNLTRCSNLTPDKVFLSCPSLQSIHCQLCKEELKYSIHDKIKHLPAQEDEENLDIPQKRMADGSKRVLAPSQVMIEPFKHL